MNLVIDIGNTRTKMSLFKEGELLDLHIQESGKDIEISSEWLDMARQAIVSSVYGDNPKLEALLAQHINRIILMKPGVSLPLKVVYKTPETLGSDRIAAAIGAIHLYPGKNLLVINAGTALTIDEINEAGDFLGGNISPGIRMRFQALHKFTQKLPFIEYVPAFNTPGNSTTEAIRAGVLQGILHEVEGYISFFRNKHTDTEVLITGGDSDFFAKYLKNTIFVLPNLVLIGLDRILEHNA